MKKGLKQVAPLVFPLFLLGGLFCGAIFLNVQFGGFVPAAVEVLSPQGTGLVWSDAAQILDEQAGANFGCASYSSAVANVFGGREVPVRVAAVNSAYGTAASLRYLSGGFFLADTLQSGRRYAVLPDTLALDWFLTVNAVGNTILLDGNVYTVCGIYDSPKGFLPSLALAAQNCIYISRPLGAEAAPLQQLVLAEPSPIPPESLVQQVADLCQSPVCGTAHDWRSARALGSQILYFSFLVCCIPPLVCLLRQGGRCWLRLYTKPQHTKRQKLFGFLKGCGFVSAALLALHWLFENAALPAAYLPADNLFELGHYAGLIRTFCVQAFAAGEYGLYSHLALLYFPCILLLCAWGCAVWWRLWYRLGLKIKTAQRDESFFSRMFRSFCKGRKMRSFE